MLNCPGLHHDPKVLDQASPGGLQHYHMRCARLSHPRPIPESPGTDLPPKKCNLARWRPVPVKNVNFSRAPGIVIAVSWTPYYPSDSQLQVYHLYTEKGTLAGHARDVNILSGPRASRSIMEQMIASWSMVMVHGLMVADQSSQIRDRGLASWPSRAVLWGLEQCSRRSAGYLARPTTKAPKKQIYFTTTGLGPIQCPATLRRPRRTGKSVDRE